MIIEIIEKAKILLVEQNIKPPFTVKLSPQAHESLITEMSLRDGKKRRINTQVFEVLGMRVEIDPRCPQGAAYIKGEEDEVPR